MPYFGRVDFQEEGEAPIDQLYIGLTSVMNTQRAVVCFARTQFTLEGFRVVGALQQSAW